MINCYKPLAIRSFILEVRSWSGNQMLVPVWTRKSQVPSTAVVLPGPGPDWEEEELSWQLPQGKVPRPCQLSPLRETGSQPNRPSDSSGSHIVEARSRRLHTMPMLWGGRGRDGERVSTSGSGPRSEGGPGKGSGAPQNTAPNLFPGLPQLTCWP